MKEMKARGNPLLRMGLKERMKQVNPFLVPVIILFALSGWIDMYGLWVQVPILVHKLPEGWSLPSYIIIILDISVLCPLLYTFINKVFPGNVLRREVIMAYCIMCTGLLALVLLSIFWQYTAWVAGAERSLPVLLLVLCLAVVDTSSSVVYVPYMSRFSEYYMPIYIAGEEMGGLITGIVGLMQGAGGESTCYNKTSFLINHTTGENYTLTELQIKEKEPLFPPSGFFIFLACMMVVSLISFSILHFSSFARKEMVPEKSDSVSDTPEKEFLKEKTDKHPKKGGGMGKEIEMQKVVFDRAMLRGQYVFCLLTYALAAFLVFGFFPSIQSYSTLPYGAMAYTLALRIGSVTNPLAALTAFFFPARSLLVLGSLAVFSTSLIGYHFFLAMQSPVPPLQDHIIGSIIVAITGPLVTGAFAYTRASIATLLRTEGGHKALITAGACLQVGACLGGVTSFTLVNVLNLFLSKSSCA